MAQIAPRVIALVEDMSCDVWDTHLTFDPGGQHFCLAEVDNGSLFELDKHIVCKALGYTITNGPLEEVFGLREQQVVTL